MGLKTSNTGRLGLDYCGSALGNSGGLLWTRWWTVGLHNRRRISWSAEQL